MLFRGVDSLLNSSEAFEVCGRWLRCCLVGFAFCHSIFLSTGQSPSPWTVRSYSELYSSQTVESTKPVACEMRAVVSHYDASWSVLWFFDGQQHGYLNPGVKDFGLNTGDRIVIRGQTKPGTSELEPSTLEIDVVGPGEPPTATLMGSLIVRTNTSVPRECARRRKGAVASWEFTAWKSIPPRRRTSPTATAVKRSSAASRQPPPRSCVTMNGRPTASAIIPTTGPATTPASLALVPRGQGLAEEAEGEAGIVQQEEPLRGRIGQDRKQRARPGATELAERGHSFSDDGLNRITGGLRRTK